MWYQKEIIITDKNRGFHLITDEIIKNFSELNNISIGLKKTPASILSALFTEDGLTIKQLVEATNLPKGTVVSGLRYWRFEGWVTSEEGNISTVFLDGEIDMDKTEAAKEVIMPLIEAKKEVHLNLKDVQYMDSSGISVLIESHQKAEELGTKVTLKEINKTVLKVIMMAKLEQILNLD